MSELATAPRRVDFLRTKYGPELLLDAAWLSEMAAFDATPAPYSLTFFDITLVTAGSGRFDLDAERFDVAPGLVLFTRPGEVRRWRVGGLDGACVFFTGDFLREAFRDERILQRFAYWRDGRRSGGLILAKAEQAEFVARFEAMRREFDTLGGDAAHLLRARLYELLVLLNRWYVARHGEAPPAPAHPSFERFLALVERDFASGRRLAAYAAEVGLTPGHLNALCRRLAGRSAGEILRGRIMLEARRQLLYGDQPVANVGYALGFADPPYFTRFFRREAGMTPQAFRAAMR